MATVETLATDISYIRQGIDELKEHAKVTNGRVTNLERVAIVLKVVMWFITAICVPTFLMLINQGIVRLFT